MASLFIAEALGDPLSIGEQISLLVYMVVASKGAAGVTGAGLATWPAGSKLATAQSWSTGQACIVGSTGSSPRPGLTNFAGNTVATRCCRALDTTRATSDRARHRPGPAPVDLVRRAPVDA